MNRSRTATRSALNSTKIWPLQFHFIFPGTKISFHETRKFTTRSPAYSRRFVDSSVFFDWHFDCEMPVTYHTDTRMIRIEASEERDIVTLFLSGRIQKDDLGELKSVLARHTKSVVLDLSGVNLIDRDVVKFLAGFETARAKLANCPRYIREWILRERTEP
jgi:ABC-type transporter Mla MlaB component